ncbi:hypothetical protein APF79_09595, partial [bacterium BRH_c32]
ELIEKYIFKDKVSGLKKESDREDLPKLLKLTKDQIDIVYIWEISRLSRDPIYFEELILHFKQRGINLCFLRPTPLYLFDVETGSEDLITGLALSIFSKFALFEIQQKNQRQKRGKIYSVLEKENTYTYKPPYGYKKVNKKLTVNNDPISDITGFRSEKEVVTSIFEMYASGKTLRQLMNVLNENKIKTRSASFLKKDQLQVNEHTSIDKDKIKWSRRSINAILTNTVYCGYKEINFNERDKNRVITDTNKHTIETQSIISKDLFLKVQDQLKLNISVANKAYKNEFLIRGLLYCGFCGDPYVGSGSKGRNYYVCADRTKRRSNTFKNCRNSSINNEIIDNLIWNSIKGYYKVKISKETKDIDITNIERKIYDLKVSIENKKQYSEDYKKQQLRISKQIANVPDDIGYNLTKEINSIEIERKRLQTEINALHKQISIYNDQLEAIKDEEAVSFNSKGNLIVKDLNIDEDFILKQEAVKSIIQRIDFYKYDTDTRIIHIDLKTGYKLNVLYSLKSSKTALSLIDQYYSFNKETFTFKKSLTKIRGNYETGDYKVNPDSELSYIEETPLQTLQNAGLIKSDKPKSFFLNPENEKITRLPLFFELIQIN